MRDASTGGLPDCNRALLQKPRAFERVGRVPALGRQDSMVMQLPAGAGEVNRDTGGRTEP